jgi:hypothetical protein
MGPACGSTSMFCRSPRPTPATGSISEKTWERAQVIFPHLARMEALYNNIGIETRYSCVPADWSETPHR